MPFGEAAATIGSTMVIFPRNFPRLDVINVAGTNIAVGVSAPIQLQLPFGASTNQSVTIQAQNFNGEVPIRVVLTPQSGPILSFDATITNTTQNPAAVTVPVTVPINQLVTVNAWTR
jgi:Flp pilus assembly protein TadG